MKRFEELKRSLRYETSQALARTKPLTYSHTQKQMQASRQSDKTRQDKTRREKTGQHNTIQYIINDIRFC